MKRLLLILAAIIGLVVAGSALAGKSGSMQPDQALQALVAPGTARTCNAPRTAAPRARRGRRR